VKSRDEIHAAHDRLTAIVLGEVPCPFQEGPGILIPMLDVLCWVLDHDHNINFALNLANIDKMLGQLGFVLEKRVEPTSPFEAQAQGMSDQLRHLEVALADRRQISFSVDEGQRQQVLLALAVLSVQRPGWGAANREVAKQFGGELAEKTYTDLLKYNSTPRRVCKVCGCTDDRACEGGCHWVAPDMDICSQCVERLTQLVREGAA
jgi:hypothetical protein